MADYSDDIQFALDSISDAGEVVTYIPYQQAAQQIPMLFLPDTRLTQSLLVESKAAPLPQSYTLAMMGAVNFQPSEKDLIKRADGVTEFKLLSLNELNPNGQSILWVMHLVR